MKKTLLVLPVLILLLCIPVRAGADFSAADSAAGETPLGTPTEIVKSILDNSLNLDGQSILKNICQILFAVLKSSLPSLTCVFAAAVLLSVAKSGSFLGNASEAALMGGRAVTAVILLLGAISVIKSAKASLETVDAFSGALMPVMCTLLASSGAQSASATLAPSSAMLSTLLIKILSNFVFPLITGAMALSLAVPSLAFIGLSIFQSESIWVTSLFICLDQFGYGFGFTAYMLYMIYFSRGEFKTSHYSLCTAFMSLSMMLPGLVAGYLQELLGYTGFFILVGLCCLVTVGVTFLLNIDEDYGKK